MFHCVKAFRASFFSGTIWGAKLIALDPTSRHNRFSVNLGSVRCDKVWHKQHGWVLLSSPRGLPLTPAISPSLSWSVYPSRPALSLILFTSPPFCCLGSHPHRLPCPLFSLLPLSYVLPPSVTLSHTTSLHPYSLSISSLPPPPSLILSCRDYQMLAARTLPLPQPLFSLSLCFFALPLMFSLAWCHRLWPSASFFLALFLLMSTVLS